MLPYIIVYTVVDHLLRQMLTDNPYWQGPSKQKDRRYSFVSTVLATFDLNANLSRWTALDPIMVPQSSTIMSYRNAFFLYLEEFKLIK